MSSRKGPHKRASSESNDLPHRKKRKNPSFEVPLPTPDAAPDPLMSTNRARATGNRLDREDKQLTLCANMYMKNAQVIRAPFTRESLEGPQDVESLAKICETELGQTMDAQYLSAKIIDKDGKPILFYLGYRPETKDKRPPPEIALKDQYINRTKAYMDALPSTVSTYFDGINSGRCSFYQVECQRLATKVSLHPDGNRHTPLKTMAYKVECDTVRYATRSTKKEEEREENSGVLHLVQGWIQQGQGKKGLFLSRDITRSSSANTKVMSFYKATDFITRNVSILFKAVFPDYHRRYQQAFEAGVWYNDDSGPFLGRAIVYKLQGELHRDRNDVGPSVCFPVGNYTGGEMMFPQLGAKFAYGPGCVCIFFSSNLYHKVSHFTPKPQTIEQKAKNITPGRIGSVFFFPQHSYETLEGKPKEWAKTTDYGTK